MSISLWPEQERPREKLLQRGSASLSDAELLAIFLRTGIQGVSAVELGRQLLSGFGSLNALFNASEAEFCQAKGLGVAKYVQLQAVLEMSRRYLYEQLEHKDVLQSADAAKRFVRARLKAYEYEVFACLFLDAQHQLICFEELFQGSLQQAPVFPREIARKALKLNAAAVILCHNHPSGVAEPSLADKSITEQIQQALALLDIKVLDHLLVAGCEVLSFAERGLL
jgi:DNA repair protein RadC